MHASFFGTYHSSLCRSFFSRSQWQVQVLRDSFFEKKNCLECSVVEALSKTQERKTARNAGDRFVNGETTHTLPSSTVHRGDDTVVFETVDKETEDTDPPHEKSSDIEPEFHRKEQPTKFHELQLEIRPK